MQTKESLNDQGCALHCTPLLHMAAQNCRHTKRNLNTAHCTCAQDCSPSVFIPFPYNFNDFPSVQEFYLNFICLGKYQSQLSFQHAFNLLAALTPISYVFCTLILIYFSFPQNSQFQLPFCLWNNQFSFSYCFSGKKKSLYCFVLILLVSWFFFFFFFFTR